MRRALQALALSLVLSPLTFARGADATTLIIRRSVPAVTAVSGPTFQAVSSTSGATSVVSATCTLTTTGSTTKVLAGVAFRRNSSQTNNVCTYNGVSMTDTGATATAASGHRLYLYSLDNPGAVTNGNLSCTLSASAPGVGLSAIAFTGSTTIKSTGTTAGSVTTSSATATTSVGDMLVDVLIKQDPSTSNPTLNTAAATLRLDFSFSSTGNGAFDKWGTNVATATSTTTNFSWPTAANTAHSWVVLGP